MTKHAAPSSLFRTLLNLLRRPRPAHSPSAAGPSAPVPAPSPSKYGTLSDLIYVTGRCRTGGVLRPDGRYVPGGKLRPDGRYVAEGFGPHEGLLAHFPERLDFTVGARPGAGSEGTSFPHHGRGGISGDLGASYRFHNAWIEVAVSKHGTGERRVRVQVDLPQVWHLSADGVWSHVGPKTPEEFKRLAGGFWTASHPEAPHYRKVVPFASHVREEAEGWSFDVSPMVIPHRAGRGGVANPDAYFVHAFWPGFMPRLEMPVGGQVAILGRMRLLPADDVDNVDLSRARFLGCLGGDVFEFPTTRVAEDGVNPAFLHPRFVNLSADWTTVGFITGTVEQALRYPHLPALDPS